jgi:hypothetical protein
VLLKASRKDASETKCTDLLKIEAFNILKVKKKSKEIGINAVGAGWRLQMNTNRPCHPSEYCTPGACPSAPWPTLSRPIFVATEIPNEWRIEFLISKANLLLQESNMFTLVITPETLKRCRFNELQVKQQTLFYADLISSPATDLPQMGLLGARCQNSIAAVLR